jgi:hypothetical protein
MYFTHMGFIVTALERGGRKERGEGDEGVP